MKKNIFLFSLFIFFSFNAFGNDSSEFIDLKIPEEYKSKIKFDESQIHMYTVVTKCFDTKKVKGKLTMISDGYGKIIKIIVPENFPNELSFEKYINSTANSEGIPCRWCVSWWCWLICEVDAPGPDRPDIE